MPISFQCGACMAKIKAPDTAAGKNSRCPRCRELVRVPEVAMDAAGNNALSASEAKAAATVERLLDSKPERKADVEIKIQVVAPWSWYKGLWRKHRIGAIVAHALLLAGIGTYGVKEWLEKPPVAVEGPAGKLPTFEECKASLARNNFWQLGRAEGGILRGRPLTKTSFGPDANYPANSVDVWQDSEGNVRAISTTVMGEAWAEALRKRKLNKEIDASGAFNLQVSDALRRLVKFELFTEMDKVAFERFAELDSNAQSITKDKAAAGMQGMIYSSGLKMDCTRWSIPDAKGYWCWGTLVVIRDGTW